MSKTLLVIDRQADRFRELIEPEPGLEVLYACDRDAAVRLIPEADALLLLGFVLDSELLRRAGKLEWIQTLTTGSDHITGVPGLPPDVTLTSARGIHGPQMAELALLHMMALMRQFPRLLDNQRQRVWEQWPQPLLSGKTVAVLGVGAIAEDFARRARAFDMQVVGISGTPRSVPHFDRVVTREQMPEVLADADFLVVLVPHTAETTKIVNAATFAAMKPSAFLVNLARGGVVDEEALLDALRNATIAGAGLDVFTAEPLPVDNPLWTLPNVIVSPHIGGYADTIVARGIAFMQANLRRYLAGDCSRFVNVVRRGKLVATT